MAFDVHVKGTGATLSVASETTILEAALAAGIAYPHGCKAGRCGACKTRLLEGEVDLLKHTPFSLTEYEKQHGLILACRALPRANCVVKWIASDAVDHAIRDVSAHVLSIENATHDIKVIRLRLDAGDTFAFSAGQYAELTFPECPPRPYSMANRPGSDVLEFHVRRVAGGIASDFAATRLREGDTVRLRGPFGTTHLRTDHTGPILAIAGGSGLAPIASIVEAALYEGMRQPIHVYLGARTERDIYREAQFRELGTRHLNLSFTPVLSDSAAPGSRRRGLVTAAVAEDWTDLRSWTAYMAGPPPMVDAATALVVERGLAAQDLHADAFFTAADQARASLGGMIAAT